MAAPGQAGFTYDATAKWTSTAAAYADAIRQNHARLNPAADAVLAQLAQRPSLRLIHPATHLDALAALNELAGHTTKREYDVVLYGLGLKTRPPGAGSLADLSFAKNVVSGRPTFPGYTQDRMRPGPLQARRHIIAWHAIRDLANRYVAAAGAPNAAKNLRQWYDAARPKLPPPVVSEAERILPDDGSRPPPLVLGTDPNAGRAILRALFVANGNPRNLWLGNGDVNSALPGRFLAARNAIARSTDPQKLLQDARAWRAATDGSALWWAGWAIGDAVDDIDPAAYGDPATLLELLRSVGLMAIIALEVDQTPGDKDEALGAYTTDHDAMAKLGIQLYAALQGAPTPAQIQALAANVFPELLAYPPT